MPDRLATLPHYKNRRSAPWPEPHDLRRYRPGAAHLRGLGERPIAEFLQEIGIAHGIEDDILERLDRWRDHLTPELLRAVGGDCWPPALAMLRGGRR